MSEREYLSCAETAKLLRKNLKEKFPKTKFSVRSSVYSMGASIDVRYENGPSLKEVEAIAKSYEGAGFDGMIDLKFYKTHYLLPNGTVLLAKSEGTVDSRGVYPSYDAEKPEGAKPVSFGADYVFVNREISEEIQQDVAKTVAKNQGMDFNGNLNTELEGMGRDFNNFLWRFLRDKDLRNYKGVKHKKDLQSGQLEDFWEIVKWKKN